MIFSNANLSPAHMAALARRYEERSGVKYPAGLLHQLVIDGTYQLVIAGDSEPQYAYWFYTQVDKMFHPNSVLSLGRNHPSDLIRVSETVARDLHCRGMVFETAKPGIVRQSEKQGYRQTGVVMEKVFV